MTTARNNTLVENSLKEVARLATVALKPSPGSATDALEIDSVYPGMRQAKAMIMACTGLLPTKRSRSSGMLRYSANGRVRDLALEFVTGTGDPP